MGAKPPSIVVNLMLISTGYEALIPQRLAYIAT
jgi:hypothetical protein